MAIDINKKNEKDIFTCVCANKNCGATLMFDGEYQDDLQKTSNNIIIKGVAILKIDKQSKKVMAKCRRCKTWNLLGIKIVL